MRAAHKVRVNVSLSRRRDAQIVGFGENPIAVDVALGIDNESLSRPRTTDKVGVLGKARVAHLPEKHGKRRIRFVRDDYSISIKL